MPRRRNITAGHKLAQMRKDTQMSRISPTRMALALATMTVSLAAMPALASETARDGARGEARGAAMMFDRLDADGDGVITRAEIEAARLARAAEMDADGDGTITREEFVAWHAARAAERAERRAGRMFDRVAGPDAEGIAPEQMLREGRIDRMFARLDTDGDGAISREEFEAGAARMRDRRGEMRERHRGEGQGMRHGQRHGGGKGRSQAE